MSLKSTSFFDLKSYLVRYRQLKIIIKFLIFGVKYELLQIEVLFSFKSLFSGIRTIKDFHKKLLFCKFLLVIHIRKKKINNYKIKLKKKNIF